jgi:hypothetical protein
VRETAQALGVRFLLHKPVDEQALLDAIACVTQPVLPPILEHHRDCRRDHLPLRTPGTDSH